MIYSSAMTEMKKEIEMMAVALLQEFQRFPMYQSLDQE